ncbi:MAG: hypothetical protein Q4C49_02255 [Bacillota bacterium]|nr:hypothetical protein [Bacillota bacterium]
MIQVFTGPMYGAKSLKLIEVYQYTINKQKDNVLCFKPAIDVRDYAKIASRNQTLQLDAIIIDNLNEIKEHITEKTQVVLIDEAQFLHGSERELLDLSLQGIDVYVAGLALTSEQTPFGIMPNIMAISNSVIHSKARCNDCETWNAEYTYCIAEKSGEILVGSDQYIALCESCFRKRVVIKGAK